MPNAFEEAFGIPLPKCCSLGECCKGASPSKPFHQLMARAAEGDEFARNFFSIMIPYPTQADAEAVVPGLVKRMRTAAMKLPDFGDPDELVFYHCRYLSDDNRCGVHEDRPQFCRDYPDTPFVVTAPGCAFEGWVAACKQKYHNLQEEVSELKQLKSELETLKSQLGQQTVSAPMGNPQSDMFGIDAAGIGSDNGQKDVHETPSLTPLGFLPIAYLPGMNVGAPLGNIILFSPC